MGARGVLARAGPRGGGKRRPRVRDAARRPRGLRRCRRGRGQGRGEPPAGRGGRGGGSGRGALRVGGKGALEAALGLGNVEDNFPMLVQHIIGRRIQIGLIPSFILSLFLCGNCFKINTSNQ